MRSAVRQNLALACGATFAFLWVVARACVQSVTIDEADTFLAYVAPQAPTHWLGSANNQLLNSLLMRLTTSVFGVSHLTLRTPALIGAAIYIAAAYIVARAIARRNSIAVPLLACLVLNPFVMDHLVAARGYSLALGLWMAMLAMPLSAALPPARACALASLAAGLSFSANFSFALVDAATLLLVGAWAWRRGVRPGVIAGCTLPGLAAALAISGSVLASWPRNQLVYGSHSLAELFDGIQKCSLYELNPYLVNPPLRLALERVSCLLFPLLAAACLWRGTNSAVWHARRPAAFAAIGTAAIAAHWLLFRLAHVLLPKERTGVWIAPLLFLVAGSLAAVPGGGAFSRRAVAVMLACFACYFACCLRLTYFREWKWNAEMQQAYRVLARYDHTRGLKEVIVNWRYTAALNYYRAASAEEEFAPVEPHLPPYPAGADAYVLYYPDEEEFIRRRHLKLAWYGRLSDTAVAIDRRLEEPPEAPLNRSDDSQSARRHRSAGLAGKASRAASLQSAADRTPR